MVFLLLLCFHFALSSSSSVAKTVTLYNNGESVNGIAAVIDESLFAHNFTGLFRLSLVWRLARLKTRRSLQRRLPNS